MIRVCLLWLAACSISSSRGDYPFRNTSLGWDERVADIVSRLSLDELVPQLSTAGGTYRFAPNAVPRLGIKPYNFDTVCFHGILREPSTTFPQSVGIAATFSPKEAYKVGKVISVEARGIANNASAHGDYGIDKSVSCLAPFINIVHHPLWGRIQEVYGEDPYLSGEMAAHFVKGLQGDHPRYVRANSGCLTVDVHSGPDDYPVPRFTFNAIVSERDMRLTYLPNFKKCIDAGTYTLMCSYNKINGVPSCANKWLLKQVLRDEYGFKGYFIGDEDAITRIYISHHYVGSLVEAAAAAANAGVNLDFPRDKPAYSLLKEAVARGMVTVATLRELAKPLFYTRMRLGEFDPPENNPYAHINTSVIQCAEHREQAIVTATKTFVLLKNEQSTLPLKAKLNKMAMIGPLCNNLLEQYGDYSPKPVPRYATTLYQGLQPLAKEVMLVKGCDKTECTKYDKKDVKEKVAMADLSILCLGTGLLETESRDRRTLALPGLQEEVLKNVVSYAKGRPVILLLINGGPLDLAFAKSHPGVHAILQISYPGQGGGEALRRALTGWGGTVTSPAGRLPLTYPASLKQVPPITNYSMEGRTYRYSHFEPLYPFGYGLSYSSFHYSNLQAPAAVSADGDVQISVDVTNKGPYDADEVTQVYLSWVNCSVPMPRIQMVGVKRQMLSVGPSVQTRFTITSDQLKVWDDHVGFIYFLGEVDVYVGGQQPYQKTSVGSNVLNARIQINKPSPV